MNFIFNEPRFVIGTNDIQSPIQMFNRNFLIGGATGEPTWQDIVISGIGALTLVNAKADSLEYLKLFGKTINQSILPSGYTQYTYLRNGASAQINTGFRPTVDDITFEIRWLCGGTSSMYLWQSRDGNSGNILGLGGSQSGATITLYGGDGTVCTSGISRTSNHIYYTKATLKNGNGTLYVRDENDSTEDTQTGTYTFSANSTNMFFFGNLNQYVGSGYRIYSARCWYQGQLVQNWLPCTNSSDVMGLYDTVGGTFITNTTASYQVGTEVTSPTADSCMNIVCNNGALKVKHKTLPSAYQEVFGLKGDGNAYINLNTALTQDDEIEIKFSISSATAKEGLFGCRTNASTNNIAVAFANNANSEIVADFNNSNYTNFRLQQSISPNIIYTLIINKNKRAIYNGDTLIAENSTICNDTITISNCFLYMIAGSPAYQDKFTGTIYSCKIKNKRNVIPCRRLSDSVLGMYDTISETFLTNTGSGSFTAGVDCNTDWEVYSNGTVETVEDELENTATATNLYGYSTYADVQEVKTGAIDRQMFALVLTGDEVFSSSTVSGTKRYIYDLDNVSQALADGRSSRGSILSTHFNSIHNSASQTTGGAFTYNKSKLYMIPFDQTIATVDDFTAWVKEQYLLGTPLIFVYPMNTPTTESVTGQTMNVKAGENTIEITQASISGLSLEAKYQAGVSVTVTEIENANLDNQVTVTIGE